MRSIKIKLNVVDSLKDDSEAIVKATLLSASNNVLAEFSIIFNDYSFFSVYIVIPESIKLFLQENLNVLGKVLNKMKVTSYRCVKDKLRKYSSIEKCRLKNSNFHTVK